MCTGRTAALGSEIRALPRHRCPVRQGAVSTRRPGRWSLSAAGGRGDDGHTHHRCRGRPGAPKGLTWDHDDAAARASDALVATAWLWWTVLLLVLLRVAAIVAFRSREPAVLDRIRQLNKHGLNPLMLHLAGKPHWYAAKGGARRPPVRPALRDPRGRRTGRGWPSHPAALRGGRRLAAQPAGRRGRRGRPARAPPHGLDAGGRCPPTRSGRSCPPSGGGRRAPTASPRGSGCAPPTRCPTRRVSGSSTGPWSRRLSQRGR